jgi:hypothetical protein
MSDCRSTLLAAFAALLLLVHCAHSQLLDAEGLLARDREAREAYQKLVGEVKLSAEERADRRQWLAQNYPHSDWVTRTEADALQELYAAKKWDGYARQAAEFLAQPHHGGQWRREVLSRLESLVNDKTAPDADRRAALDVLLKNCRSAARILFAVRRYIHQLPLSEEEKWRMAKQAAEICGNHPSARRFLWYFMPGFNKSAPAAVVSDELKWFLQKFGDDSSESIAARRMLLSREANAGNAKATAQLAKLQEQEKQNAEAVAQLYQKVAAQAKTDEAGSLETLRQARELPTRAVDSSWWKGYVHGLRQRPVQMQAALLAAKVLPPGRVLDDLWSVVRDKLSDLPEAVDFNLAYFGNPPEDIDYDLSRVESFLKDFSALDTDARRRFQAHQVAAEVAGRLGEKEIEADYLFKAGKYGWDLDRAAALADLHRAMEVAPDCSSAIEAQWFLDLLEGSNGIVQTSAPRYLGARQSRQDVTIELPEYSGETSSVTVAAGQVMLKKFDLKQNLLAGQLPSASSGQSSASFATDGKDETVWKPDALPAAMIVPLRASASPQRLFLHFGEPTYFTVSLLDATGRVLARYERDWEFWEHYQSRQLWPDAEETLNLLPVGGACFVKVEIYASLGVAPSLKEIAAFPFPYAATGWHLSPAQTLPAGEVLRVAWQADEPEKEVTYGADSEGARGFPIFRWRDPWLRTKRTHVPLRKFGAALGLQFFGDNAGLSLRGRGRAYWSLEDGRGDAISQNDSDANASFTHRLADDLAPGRHLLTLGSQALSQEEGDNFTNSIEYEGVTVRGHSTASRLIRFGDGKNWGAWLGPLRDAKGTRVKVPVRVNSAAPTQYQIASFLDARGTQAQITPQTEDKTTVAAEPSGAVAQPATFVETPSLVSEDLDAVAKALQQRRVVVSYPKHGSAEEFHAAQRLAEKAGVYLVSDDIVLNGSHHDLILAVGTPLSHRINRQLLAMAGLWNDPQYLNSDDGIVSRTSENSKFPFLFVTGETPAAVERAAKRLLAHIPERKAPTQPFRVFGSNTLEMVYAWQLHPEREKPQTLSLRLAQNDRRGLQFGVSANRDIKALQITASTLTGPNASTLPAPQARVVGFYEWEPFFGDLRVPNTLSEEKSTPLGANSSTGVWLTARSRADTKPGVYRGNITIAADGYSETLPLQITVEPIALPVASHLRTFSFAMLPWYFHEGTPEYEKALRELAENEAEHGVNTVNPKLEAAWKMEPTLTPARYCVAAPSTPITDLKWKPYSENAKTARPGEAIFFGFENPVDARLVNGAFRVEKKADIALSVYDEGVWHDEKPQNPVGEDVWVAAAFPVKNEKWQIVRFESTQLLQIGKLNAFADPENDGPLAFDFAATTHRMDVYDEVYRRRNLPLPMFLCYANFDRGGAARTLLGVNDDYYGGHVVATDFTRQLKVTLQKTGREQRFILKVADEPSDIVEWTKIARAFQAGGLPVMTAHSGNYKNIEAAVGVMNPWCPNYQHNVLRPFFKERQQAGDAVWWYICGVPATRITGTPIENLPFYWLSAKWNFDGAVNYAALTGGEANEAVPFRYDHGLMHRLAYKPDGTLLDTTRRELEGDGIQDYKLIEYVRNRIAAWRKANQSAKADATEKKLNAIIDAIVPYKYGYSQQPEDWYRARNALYDLAASAD